MEIENEIVGIYDYGPRTNKPELMARLRRIVLL